MNDDRNIEKLLHIQFVEGKTVSEIELNLIKEHLRRMALWAKHFEVGKRVWYSFDVAERINPNIRANPAEVEKLTAYFEKIGASLFVRGVCERFLHWEAVMAEEKKVPTFPSPYDPIIKLLENGIRVRTEHGFIDVNGHLVQCIESREYMKSSPFA